MHSVFGCSGSIPCRHATQIAAGGGEEVDDVGDRRSSRGFHQRHDVLTPPEERTIDHPTRVHPGPMERSTEG